MKKIILVSFLGLLFSCSSETESETTQDSQNTTETSKSTSSEEIEGPAPTTTKSYDEPNIVTDFLADITSLEESESKNPIVAFQEIANNTAARKALISKSNIQEMLDEAKNYKTLCYYS